MKFIGKKSLSVFMTAFLWLFMTCTVLMIVFLPWIVDYYLILMYEGVNESIKVILMVVLYPLGIAGLFVENELRKMFKTLVNKDPFVVENVKSLRRMGLAMLVVIIAFIYKVIVLNSLTTMLICLIAIIITVFCFVLADIFNQAVIYKHDNDLTI